MYLAYYLFSWSEDKPYFWEAIVRPFFCFFVLASLALYIDDELIWLEKSTPPIETAIVLDDINDEGF